MTEKLDLEAIEARCEAATKGPWYVVGPPWRASHYDESIGTYRPLGTYVVAGNPDPHVGNAVIDSIEITEWDIKELWPDYSQSDADLEFCAGARSDIPALLAEVRRLRASLAAVLEETESDHDRDIIVTECRSALAEVRGERIAADTEKETDK